MNTKRTPGPLELRPSSNPKNGTQWRDIVSVGQPFSPSYVGEALEPDAKLFVAAPAMYDVIFEAMSAMTNWARLIESKGDRATETEKTIAYNAQLLTVEMAKAIKPTT